MNIIRDYNDVYKRLGNIEFCTFYTAKYEILKDTIYRMWLFPSIIILIIASNKLFIFPSLFMIKSVYEWMLLIVGVICTILVINDKWYGALIFALLLLWYLVGGIGKFVDKFFWAFGAIASIRTMLRLLELKNLMTYFKMARAVIMNGDEDEL